MRRLTLLAAAAALLAPAAAARADDFKVVSSKPLTARVTEYAIHTSALASDTHVRVMLPAGYDASDPQRYPVLYLLHGCCDNYASWTDKGDAEKITAGLPLIVVMPDAGQAGFYSDWYNNGAGGPPEWETYHIDQLIPWVDRTFNTIASRDGRATTGLSMGGFGAMSYAARHPDMFVAAASFSGAVDNMDSSGEAEGALNLADGAAPDSVWGPKATEAIRWRGHNPTDLAENLRGLNLTIRTGNGEPGGPYGGGPDAIEMSVHTQSITFHNRLDSLKIPHVFEDYGPGAHDWPYWQRDLRNTLPAIMRTFADPPPPPAAVTYTAIEPKYSIFGWSVSLQRPALEFSRLDGATGQGFRLTGSGKATVVTPALYAPGSTHGVTAGTASSMLTADDAGRLTIPVDLGPANAGQQNQPYGTADPSFKTVPVSIGASAEAPRSATAFTSCKDHLAPRAVARASGSRLSGTALDRGCSGLARVEVSVAKRAGKRCRFLDQRGRLSPRPRACERRRYLVVRGTGAWKLGVKLPKGRLAIVVRVTDLAGNVVRARAKRG